MEPPKRFAVPLKPEKKKRTDGPAPAQTLVTFDPSEAVKRLDTFWSLSSCFGIETDAIRIYLDEIVSDRFALIKGMQILHDELQLAFWGSSDVKECAADLSKPTVITTLAHTNCGDRIQREATPTYERIVGSRFATLSEDGRRKIEMFSPAGGGTDDGFILAHVTVAHQMDAKIRAALYNGNPQSYVSVNIDLMGHVGRLDSPDGTQYGLTKESPWREERNACGAIIGLLTHYNPANTVHRRLRSNLGEDNYAFLSQQPLLTADGTNITYVVAAAIVVIQGLYDTCQALKDELDERGLAHLTATLTVNRMTYDLDQLMYLARATVFQHRIKISGFGTDARKYAGRMVVGGESTGMRRNLTTSFKLVPSGQAEAETSVAERHLVLTYDGREGAGFEPLELTPQAVASLSQATDL